jgi:hypothetical protein
MDPYRYLKRPKDTYHASPRERKVKNGDLGNLFREARRQKTKDKTHPPTYTGLLPQTTYQPICNGGYRSVASYKKTI